jgi:hypothetical protein
LDEISVAMCLTIFGVDLDLPVNHLRHLHSLFSCYHLYNNEGEEVELEMSEGEKDIGVLVDRNLSFRKHITQKVNKANSIMGLVRRTYTFLDETILNVSIISPLNL